MLLLLSKPTFRETEACSCTHFVTVNKQSSGIMCDVMMWSGLKHKTKTNSTKNSMFTSLQRYLPVFWGGLSCNKSRLEFPVLSECKAICSHGWWETQGPCSLGRETPSGVGWLTCSSFVNQARFLVMRRNSPTAQVDPRQKHEILSPHSVS